MSLDNLEEVLSWAEDEGWNPGLEDAAAFFASDADGFFVKLIDDRPIAAISVVNHSDKFSFLGLYICRPQYRGQGHGLSLWNAALQHAGNRIIGLDGVPDQQANYHKSGFLLSGQTVRWQGEPELRKPTTARLNRPADFAAIVEQDFQQTGFDRRKFLTSWLGNTDTRHTMVLERNGKIAAWGTIRACREGHKIGPFTAQTEDDCHDLLAGLTDKTQMPRSAKKSGIMVDIPAAKPALSEYLGTQGFKPGFETARMYRGGEPKERLAPFSAVATLELG